MEAKNCLKYYVRNTGDGQTVSLVGEGEFTIGMLISFHSDSVGIMAI